MSKAIVGVVIGLVLLASCSTSTGAGKSTTKGSTIDASTTVAETRVSETPTTTIASVTAADLETLLPSASDVGADYRVDDSKDDSDSSDDQMDSAVKKACPEMVDVLEGMGGKFAEKSHDADRPDADRKFVTDDDRQIEVELKVTDPSKAVTKAKIAQLVAAAHKCKTFDVPMSDIGGKASVTLGVHADDTYGELGMVVTLRMVMTGKMFPKSITMNGTMQMFESHGIGVTVSAFDGLDTSTLETVPGDLDIVARLARDLDGRIPDLVSH